MIMASDANWQQIDPATLAIDLQEAYARYVQLRRAAGKAKGEFEQAMNAHAELPPGLRMVFGYNFGKLSAAIVPDDTKPAKAKVTAQSLAEFLRGQVATGRAV
jgi:hypothetical protein